MTQKKAKKKIEKEKPEEGKNNFNFIDILNQVGPESLISGCKDLFKKEKADPNVCEISIKAPSEVVLKLFGISEER